MSPSDAPDWDADVRAHPMGTTYHLSGWKNIIRETYGHNSFYLMALGSGGNCSESRVCGILPLFHMKSLIFGNQLISIPYVDFSGILAESEAAERVLLAAAVQVACGLNVKGIELRLVRPLPWLTPGSMASWTGPIPRDRAAGLHR